MELEDILSEIWKNQIREYYQQGFICSERNLQAELYYQLKNHPDIKSNNYCIWVEPTLSFNQTIAGLTNAKPDMVISREQKIECVIELKYVPFRPAKYKYDIAKLKRFSKMNRDQLLKLITISDTGLYDEKKTFKVRDNVLCVFAVISSSNADAVNKIDKNTDPILPKRFLHLAGVASKGPNHGFSAYFSLSE